MDTASDPLVERDLAAFWPFIKFIGLPFFQVANPPSAALAYDLCQVALSDVDVDAEFYLSSYPDVAPLLAAGHYVSPKDHYFRTGFFEGKFPFRIAVDASYYLDINPDVKTAVEDCRVDSAQSHFEEAGWKEGRAPYAGFSLLGQAS